MISGRINRYGNTGIFFHLPGHLRIGLLLFCAMLLLFFVVTVCAVILFRLTFYLCFIIAKKIFVNTM